MKEILERAGVSKTLFAELVGVTYTYVWYWVNNKRAMDGPKGLKARKLLEKLAEATHEGILNRVTPATKTTVVAAIRQLSSRVQ